MKAQTSYATESDTATAARACLERLSATDVRPEDLLIVYCTEQHDLNTLCDTLRSGLGMCKLFGATSAGGVMTEAGLHSADGVGLGVMLLRAAHGVVGVSLRDTAHQQAADAAAAAVHAAIIDADRPGELPALVWLHATPGQEEAVVAGIESVLGEGVPIYGGSAADNTAGGAWKLFDGEQISADGVIVAVFYTDTEASAGYMFHNGYLPSGHAGIVTAVAGRRLISVDGEPAAVWYNRCTDGLISEELTTGGNILAKTTRAPLGRPLTLISQFQGYNLAHPAMVNANGTIDLFAKLAEGDVLHVMRGSVDGLIERAGRVAKASVDAHPVDRGHIVAGLGIYCAGCMMALGERAHEVPDSYRQGLPPGTPFIGAFTFGEQGSFLKDGNKHGNLMISMVTFAV